jgi:hypothetical protein
MARGSVICGRAWRRHRKWLREIVTGKPEDPAATPAE